MYGASDPASNKTVNVRPISKFSRITANSCQIHIDLQKRKTRSNFILPQKIQLQQKPNKMMTHSDTTNKDLINHSFDDKTYIITEVKGTKQHQFAALI